MRHSSVARGSGGLGNKGPDSRLADEHKLQSNSPAILDEWVEDFTIVLLTPPDRSYHELDVGKITVEVRRSELLLKMQAAAFSDSVNMVASLEIALCQKAWFRFLRSIRGACPVLPASGARAL